ncbi:hypothetical protein JNUCC1_00922 [Lentibacillus sp. JNUCC-1]|nr:hypothetical protein [Lentibacillus sp. JNUCC-1]
MVERTELRDVNSPLYPAEVDIVVEQYNKVTTQKNTQRLDFSSGLLCVLNHSPTKSASLN